MNDSWSIWKDFWERHPYKSSNKQLSALNTRSPKEHIVNKEGDEHMQATVCMQNWVNWPLSLSWS